MPEPTPVTLKKRIRTFTLDMPGSKVLCNANIEWFEAGLTVYLGPPLTVAYDHRDQLVAEISFTPEPRFIILSELDQDPWHIRLKDEHITTATP